MADKVTFYEYDFPRNKQIATGSVVLSGKKMSVNGVAQKLYPDWLEGGIVDPKTKKKLYPKDGSAFLSVLKFRYDSPYLRASDVARV
jgi:hypothetical protein